MTDERILFLMEINRSALYNAIMTEDKSARAKAKLAENRGKRALERRGYTVAIQDFSVTINR